MRPHLPTAERVVGRPGDGEVDADEHPDGQGEERHEDDRSGDGFVATDHLHPVADDDHLDDPQQREGEPAESGESEELRIGPRLESGEHRQQHDVEDARGQVGLDAEPGDGDDSPHRGGQLRPVDAEGDPAHHRIGHTGLIPHEPGEGEQEEQQSGTDEESYEDLPGTEAEGEESEREPVVAQGVHVVGPQGEDAVGSPAAPLLAGRGEVRIVEARTDAMRRQLFGAGPQSRGHRGLRGFGLPHAVHSLDPVTAELGYQTSKHSSPGPIV